MKETLLHKDAAKTQSPAPDEEGSPKTPDPQKKGRRTLRFKLFLFLGAILLIVLAAYGKRLRLPAIAAVQAAAWNYCARCSSHGQSSALVTGIPHRYLSTPR